VCVDLSRRLAAALPDEPRWLETRGMLLHPSAVVTGGDSVDDGFVVQVFHGPVSAIAVVGRPPADAIREAVAAATELTPIITQSGDAPHVAQALAAGRAHLSGAPTMAGLKGPPYAARPGGNGGPKGPPYSGPPYTSERAILHRLTAPAARPAPDPHLLIRLLTRSDSLAHLPAGLRHEMTGAQDFAPVAAVFIDGRPVSFCYPVWRTERLWDISIDTLEEQRGRSLAARAVWFMVDLLRGEGQEPVWGALESNTASLRLGAKLGFTPMGEVAVFSRGGWVFLSGGFTGGIM
jgi:hypothetical protein